MNGIFDNSTAVFEAAQKSVRKSTLTLQRSMLMIDDSW
jgi:hypothetical protein